jgi:hypothetical protein
MELRNTDGGIAVFSKAEMDEAMAAKRSLTGRGINSIGDLLAVLEAKTPEPEARTEAKADGSDAVERLLSSLRPVLARIVN